MKKMLRQFLTVIPFLVLSLLAWKAATDPVRASAADRSFESDSVVVAPEPVEAISIFHDALAREEYASARAVVDSLKSLTDPRVKPWMRVLRATLTVTVAVDFGVEEKENLFHSDLKAAARAFVWTLKKEGESATNERKASLHAALGTINLLDAQWENEIDGDVLKAMGPAGAGYDEMSLAYELDKSRMDALLGVSAYRFFKSNALVFLSWMPFVSDNREDALLEMKRVVNTPSPSQAGAVTTLAWSLIEMDRPEEAATVCQPWLDRLNNPRHLLEPCAKAWFVAEYWDQARETYDLYLGEIRSTPKLNTGRLLGALSRSVQIAREQQDWEAVAAYCEEGLSQPLSKEEWSDYREFHDGFERYKDIAAEQLAQHDED
jgi:alkylated DNA nucleotide flippase Atl1